MGEFAGEGLGGIPGFGVAGEEAGIQGREKGTRLRMGPERRRSARVAAPRRSRAGEREARSRMRLGPPATVKVAEGRPSAGRMEEATVTARAPSTRSRRPPEGPTRTGAEKWSVKFTGRKDGGGAPSGALAR